MDYATWIARVLGPGISAGCCAGIRRALRAARDAARGAGALGPPLAAEGRGLAQGSGRAPAACSAQQLASLALRHGPRPKKQSICEELLCSGSWFPNGVSEGTGKLSDTPFKHLSMISTPFSSKRLELC